MAVIEWPRSLYRPTDITVFTAWQSRSAGRGLSGHEQVIDSGTGNWEIALTIAPDRDGRRTREFESLIARMRGRLNSALLSVCDPYKYGERISPRQIPYSDGTWHTDGTGWQASGVQPLVVTSGGAAGGTGFFVGLTEPSRPSLRIGDLLTFDGWLHRVVEANNAGWVRVEPPLRAALPVGTVLETSPPRIRCKLATDDEGRRMRERLRRGAAITINFVEDFDR